MTYREQLNQLRAAVCAELRQFFPSEGEVFELDWPGCKKEYWIGGDSIFAELVGYFFKKDDGEIGYLPMGEEERKKMNWVDYTQEDLAGAVLLLERLKAEDEQSGKEIATLMNEINKQS